MEGKFKRITKRDGRVADFDINKITGAVLKAMKASGEGDLEKDPNRITEKVMKKMNKTYEDDYIPTIEQVQDIVEESLILMDFPKTAKGYILYRQERSELRGNRKLIPENVKDLASKSKEYFTNNPLGEFIYYRTYSKWIDDEGRRETWIETVDRYINFMKENIGKKYTEEEYSELREAILKQEIMPSMRLMWSAGKASRGNNIAAYNCSYIAPENISDFAEIMYLLMSGAGVGFSVESHIVQNLPLIKKQKEDKVKTHVVEDSKEGWADALTLGLKTWYGGDDVTFDYSELRPAGARLKTMGGRSSGPDPLRDLLDFSRMKILSKQGKRLTNIDVHDIVCKIGEIVVAGGVRRSALISLSDLDDEDLRDAKMGQFYVKYPYRSMANNSAVYEKTPDTVTFMEEWLALSKAGTGERGIFNRAGLERQMPKRRWEKFKDHYDNSGSNPCGEIILRSKSFCNLTEAVARADDTKETLLRKIRLATMLGTYQSTLTDFPYISKDWKKNCEEERLLGVSITGQWDCPALQDPSLLNVLKEESVKMNEEYAKRLGVNTSMSVTCIKPSGTVSQLVNSSSGMHPRYAPYYIRRVRIAASDPLFQMLKDQKFPYNPEVGQLHATANTYVLEFPVKSPEKSVFKNDLSAIDQLNHWRLVKEHFTEHNPSVTVSVGSNEWIEVADWIYSNWEMVGGLSFLPRSDHFYQLAPYEEITKERYEELMNEMPNVDFAQILSYEVEDETTGSKAMACESGICELKAEEGEGK